MGDNERQHCANGEQRESNDWKLDEELKRKQGGREDRVQSSTSMCSRFEFPDLHWRQLENRCNGLPLTSWRTRIGTK